MSAMGEKIQTVPFPRPENPRFRFTDFFAGVGGFRLALQELGGECVFSCEIDPHARRTYAANFGEVPFDDIRRLDPADVPAHDVLTGGFPCQAFSIAGRRGGFDDARGTLFFELARVIEAVRPRSLLLENVKGLLHHDRGRTLRTIVGVLWHELGYFVVLPRVLNAKHFGLPQNRERLFIVAFADAAAAGRFAWPETEAVVRAFGQIKEPGPVSVKYFLSQRYWETLKAHRARHQSKGNGFGYEIVADEGVANAVVVGGMGRERNLVCDLAHVGLVNDAGVRRMTPREWARLQGFPDRFVIPVADTHAYKQFGNAVPVPVVRAVARQMLFALDISTVRQTGFFDSGFEGETLPQRPAQTR
ncbi:MAG: DNA (cytosine-5-)-methyltransferase [Bacteroidia bacterium]|nr:DNA (cytosine-5-)-methyltransferase [Bacteroidia bacterium]MDW8334505.1 DNA (cytosine-5-)-methyltransferase [Bacteroidia bacterium]